MVETSDTASSLSSPFVSLSSGAARFLEVEVLLAAESMLSFVVLSSGAARFFDDVVVSAAGSVLFLVGCLRGFGVAEVEVAGLLAFVFWASLRALLISAAAC